MPVVNIFEFPNSCVRNIFLAFYCNGMIKKRKFAAANRIAHFSEMIMRDGMLK